MTERHDVQSNPNAREFAARHTVRRVLLPGFRGVTLPVWLRDRLADGLAGVCLFGQNIVSADQVRALTAEIHAANPRAIIAIDEEGGDVTRLFADIGSPSPGNAALGRIDDQRLTFDAGAEIGRALRAVGCNLDFAPSVDINSNADNPVIGVRSFGGEPGLVSRHGAAWIQGLQSTGVAATAKHFPGHGDTAQDSHLAVPIVDVPLDTLRQRELAPFVAAIQAGTKVVMTSHILLPQIDPHNPATMSADILQVVLRAELGFGGVIVSDALDMAGASADATIGAAAVRALAAGCDLLCLGSAFSAHQLDDIEAEILAALTEGGLSAARVQDAAGRVFELGVQLSEPTVPATPQATHQPLTQATPEAIAAVIRAFVVQPAARQWRPRDHADVTVVRLESDPNNAVGATPWGPFAEVAHNPHNPVNEAFAEYPQFVVTAPNPSLPPLAAGEAMLVIGRDIHRHPFARAAVDRLRVEHAEVLVVDMGWPSPDRTYADVATFGASRMIGQALLAYLADVGVGVGQAGV